MGDLFPGRCPGLVCFGPVGARDYGGALIQVPPSPRGVRSPGDDATVSFCDRFEAEPAFPLQKPSLDPFPETVR